MPPAINNPVPGAVGLGSAPGKVILLGEHAVVYGHPAVAASVGLGLRVRWTFEARAPRGSARRLVSATAPAVELSAREVALDARGEPLTEGDGAAFDVLRALGRCLALFGAPAGTWRASVASDLPVGRGMGSSAALAVAALRGLGALLAQEAEVSELARQANVVEEVFHGTPSGVDAAVVSSGGVLVFRRGPPVDARPLSPPRRLPVALLDAGPAFATHVQVAQVRRLREEQPAAVGARFERIVALVSEGISALDAGDLPRLGAALTSNHEELVALGVSTPDLDALVGLALRRGALGAKLTGAGGGGLALALCPDTVTADAVAHAARARGFAAWTTLLGAVPDATGGTP